MEGEGRGRGEESPEEEEGKEKQENIYGINSAIIMKSVNCRS